MNWLMNLRIKLANGNKRVELYKKLGLNVDGGGGFVHWESC